MPPSTQDEVPGSRTSDTPSTARASRCEPNTAAFRAQSASAPSTPTVPFTSSAVANSKRSAERLFITITRGARSRMQGSSALVTVNVTVYTVVNKP